MVHLVKSVQHSLVSLVVLFRWIRDDWSLIFSVVDRDVVVLKGPSDIIRVFGMMLFVLLEFHLLLLVLSIACVCNSEG